jgi:hypothetical protein
MVPKHWIINLKNSLATFRQQHTVETIFSSVLKFTVMQDWKGACHESCGVIHILLNEFGVENTWSIGEAKVGQAFLDHSWIEIDSEVFDIAICRPLDARISSSPVIKGIDVDTNTQTTNLYSQSSGLPEDQMTTFVKSRDLSHYLMQSPMHPLIGTWALIDHIAKSDLNTHLNIRSLMIKYSGQHFTTKP